MSSQPVPRTAGERPKKQNTWERLRDEGFDQRELPAIAIAFLLVLIMLFATLLYGVARAATAETVSGTTVVPAEPGSALEISRDSVPETRLSLTSGSPGSGAAPPQQVIVLDEEVLFDFDSAELRDSAARDLQRTVDEIRASGDRLVQVVGYTDAVSPQSYNLPLSRARAETVRLYLASLGIDAERLVVNWRGEADPVASNSDPIGRQANRRVEIRLDDNGLVPVTPAVTGFADRTPEGSQFSVSQVRVMAKAAVADVTFTNAAPFPVELADDDIWLLDDQGYSYRFVPTWQNPTISVPAGSTLNGSLVFPGIVPPSVTTFTVVTNSRDPNRDLARGEQRRNDPTPIVSVSGIRAVRPTP